MHKVFWVLAAVAISIAGSAYAQAQSDPASGAEAARTSPPGGFPVGPLTVYPGIDLAHGYDDNLFLRPTNRTSSSYTNASPYVRAELKTGPHKYEFGLRIYDTRYHSSPADSFTDYSAFASGDMVFSGRAGLRVRADYRHGHDPRGSTDRTVSAAPDEYDNSSIDGTFRYGAPGARGRIEVNGNAAQRRYTNNRSSTEIADRDTTGLGGTFFWRVMPRTEVLAQMTQSYIDYPLATSTLDSTETRYYAGVKWEATAATTGTAKFGTMNKKFDSPLRQDFSGSSWDVGVRWSPLTYSVFDFVTTKQTSESTGVGDAVVGKNVGSSRVDLQACKLEYSIVSPK